MPADVYSKYGITQSEASVRGIKIIDYIEVENPDFAEECRWFPKELPIEGFDLVWSIPMKAEYAERRKITDLIAFREILQNALDAEQEAHGYENMQVRVEVNNMGTHVIDRGKGISWRAFPLGGSDKPCYARGYFGEGLNLAALAFGIRGHPLFIMSKDTVYKTFYSKYGVLAICFGKLKKGEYINGTYVLIYKYKLPKDYQDIYWKQSKGLMKRCEVYFSGEECEHPMPNIIFTDENDLKRLYVRDIFVNVLKNLIGSNAFYSYNLWWVELDPNRVNVRSSYELLHEIGRTLLNCPDSFVTMIKAVAKEKSLGGMDYLLIDLEDLVEGRVDYSMIYPIDAEKLASLKEKVRKFLWERGVTCYTVSDDIDAVPIVAHEGGKAVLVNPRLRSIFEGTVKKAHEFVIESLRKTERDSKVVDKHMLDLGTRIEFELLRLVVDGVAKKLYHDIGFYPIVGGRSYTKTTTLGGRRDVSIYLTLDCIKRYDRDVFVHELAHAVGNILFGSARDKTEEHIKALERTGNLILDLSGDERYIYARKRIKEGALNAKIKYVGIPYFVIKRLGFSVIYYNADSSFQSVYIRPMDIINRGQPPYEEHYKKVMERLILVAEEMLKIRYSHEEHKIDEVREREEKIGLVSWDMIRGIGKAALRAIKDAEREGVSNVKILAYDIVNDEYYTAKEVRLGD